MRAAIRERFVFQWSLATIVACLLLIAMASLAWLRDDISRLAKVAIELACCAFLAFDLATHVDQLRSVLTRFAYRAVTVLAVVPWYTCATTVFALPDESMVIFLAHASYAPYLYARFRAYSREHIPPRGVRIGLVLVLAYFCMHWLASIWIMLRPKADVDFATEYNLAMYFLTTTVATVGYGDITPTDNVTRLYTMGLQLLGVGMFGVVIAQVSRLAINADKRKEHAKSQVESLVSLFKHYDIPPDLQRKAYRFLNHVLAHASSEAEQIVLASLPAGLQAELRSFMNIQPLSKVVLFKGCSKACLIEAAKELEQTYFTPGQVIIKKGDLGDAMYLIGHGHVEVLDGDDLIANLTDGQCFGEMALVAEERRRADVKAVSHCDAYVLSRERFQYLLAHHAELRANVEKMMLARETTGEAAS